MQTPQLICRLTGCLLLALLGQTLPLPAGEPEDGAPDRDTIRSQMQARAKAAKVGETDKAYRAAELQPKSLMHYNDQPRRIVDATLWFWTLDGRPTGLCKIERYDHANPAMHWLYCFASLSPQLAEFEAPDGHDWKAKEPGVRLVSLEQLAPPAKGAAARLRQLKEISRRFSGTLIDNEAKSNQEMRLLPQPLARYSHEKTGLLDGALFGLAINGTNPDTILLLEIHQKDDTPVWKYGIAGMTDGGVSVRFDGREVWSKPQAVNVESHKTHTYFWERPSGKIE